MVRSVACPDRDRRSAGLRRSSHASFLSWRRFGPEEPSRSPGGRVPGRGGGGRAAETFWTAFLRKLARRGLRGVKLVISGRARGVEGCCHEGARRHSPALPCARHAQRPGPCRQERPAGRLIRHPSEHIAFHCHSGSSAARSRNPDAAALQRESPPRGAQSGPPEVWVPGSRCARPGMTVNRTIHPEMSISPDGHGLSERPIPRPPGSNGAVSPTSSVPRCPSCPPSWTAQ